MSRLSITQVSVPDGFLDLGIGQPQVDLLPLDRLKRAMDHRMNQGDPDILQYGMQQGNTHFRGSLAGFLSREYGVGVDEEALLITAGVSQALDFICSQMTRPGDTIIVEEPSYFLALRIFNDHHLNVVGTPTDENGVIIAALEEKVKRHNPKLVYTVPVFHNPTGVTLPADRREQLVSLGEQYDFLIVADEVYQLLGYSQTPPPPMATADPAGRVISLGSFSKILAPGLRLGWMQAHKRLLDPFVACGYLDSGGGLNPFVSSIVASMIELGLLKENLGHLREVYKRRLHLLGDELRKRVPGLDFSMPGGGYFIWARFRDNTDAQAVLEKAAKYRVGFQPGCKFSSRKGLGTYLRLCFAYYGDDDLVEGVDRLARAIAQ